MHFNSFQACSGSDNWISLGVKLCTHFAVSLIRATRWELQTIWWHDWACFFFFPSSPQRSPHGTPRCGSGQPEAAAGTVPGGGSWASEQGLSCTWAPWGTRPPLGADRGTPEPAGPDPSAGSDDLGADSRERNRGEGRRWEWRGSNGQEKETEGQDEREKLWVLDVPKHKQAY